MSSFKKVSAQHNELVDESTSWSQASETVVHYPVGSKVTPVNEFDFDFRASVSDSRDNIFQWKHRYMQDGLLGRLC